MARIIGNNFPNILRGTNGADLIKGLGSFDALYGRSGNDALYGGASNDFLDGGKGKDLFVGGAGKDVFNFRSGDGGFNPATGKGDIVRDYIDDVDFLSVPGSGSGAVSLVQIFDTGAGSGTIVTYAGGGGSFFVKNYFMAQWSTDDFI
jgi:Ca2+-binding RTX toxin-like protein